MYPVTTEFKDKIMTPFNRQVFGKIEVDYTDPFLDQSIDISVNEQANVSYPFQVADSVINPVGKILSLDGSCAVDGSYRLAPLDNIEVNQMGWWGSQLSDVNGDFTVPYPTLTVEFTARPILKVTVSGDSARKEYPIDFNVYMYDEVMTLLETHSVTGNTALSYKEDLTIAVTGVTTMVLEITKWSHPERQVKITEFYTAIKEVYENADIVSINLVEQREDSSVGLPFGQVTSSELSISLNNVDKRFNAGNTQSPLYNVLKPNRRIRAYLGVKKDDDSMEYVPLGRFWSEDWSVSSNTLYAKTSGKDRLSFLEDSEYSTVGVLSNISLYDLAYDVLNDYGFEDDEFFIDPLLTNFIIPYAFYEGVGHINILKEIAQACMGQVYCDRNGLIIVESNLELAGSYTAIANEEANVSYPEQVTDGVEEPSELWASLDGYSSLDGTYVLAPETTEEGQMGWWGSSLADVDGYFSTPYPTLRVEFYEKAVGSIRIVGESLREEYPVDFTVNVYDELDNLLATKSVVGNTNIATNVSIIENPTNATAIELVVTRWSKSDTQVKILEFIDMLYRPPITDAMYFVKNNPLNFKSVANSVSVQYTPMNNLGEQSDPVEVKVENTTSITENGLLTFNLKGNSLIQTDTLANEIAQEILRVFSDPRRALELQWRGDPSILLGDTIEVIDTEEENSYVVTSQTLDFTGFLRATLKGRKVVE